VNDGSTDRSRDILKHLQAVDDHLVVIDFPRNQGQHAAVCAGFGRARGEIVVTLDADLQNPPEAIPSLVAAIEAGHDVAAGWRKDRQDSLFRRWASGIANRIASWKAGVRLRDYGCMLRAYRREIAQQIARHPEKARYIPVQASRLAHSVVEVEVP